MENNDFRVVDVDPSDYLDSPQAIAAYLDDAVASGDGKILAYCLGQVARAAGMGSIANVSEIGRAHV